MSPANIHDSTKFIDVMESISNFVDDDVFCLINIWENRLQKINFHSFLNDQNYEFL